MHAYPVRCGRVRNGEIVIPLHNKAGDVVAVLDIDSPHFARFTAADREGLEAVAREIEKVCFAC